MVLQDERGSGSAKWPHRRAGGSDAELRDRACVSRGLRGKRPWSQSRGRGQGRLRTSKTSHAVREIEPLTSEFSDRLIQLRPEYRSDGYGRCVGARHQKEMTGRWRGGAPRSLGAPRLGRLGHLTKFQLSCPIFPGCPSLAGLSASIYSRAGPSRARRRPLSRGRACSD